MVQILSLKLIVNSINLNFSRVYSIYLKRTNNSDDDNSKLVLNYFIAINVTILIWTSTEKIFSTILRIY